MKRKSIVIAVSLFVIGGVIAFWIKQSVAAKNYVDNVSKDLPPRPIPTSIVKPLPECLVREFPGKVRASQRVNLAFSVPGLLVKLNALEGRVVRKGEIIAQLDQRDHQNALDVVHAKYVDAKQNFDRTTALRKSKVVPEADLDRSKATYDMAAANLRISKKSLADTILRAPFDGLIATRYLENHEHVQAKQPIVSIQDISRVEVVLQIPERLVARGGSESLQDVNVHLDADGGRWFDAKIREFSAQADPVTMTYELVLEMDPPKDIHVLPGMTATVRAKLSRRYPVENWTESLTVVPAGAVVNSPDGKTYVWVIGEVPGKPKRIPVILGAPREDGIEIRSDLHPGQRVATSGIHFIDETMMVRPMREDGEGLDG